MQLFQMWHESLLVFKPQNLKLLVLITLKSLVETYSILMRYFWWLIAGTLGFDLLCVHISDLALYIPYTRSFIWAPLAFLVFLLIRPSVARKDYAYCWSYKKQFLYFVMSILMLHLWFLLLWLVTVRSCSYHCCMFDQIMKIVSYISFFVSYGYADEFIYLSPLLIFGILFFLDSGRTWQEFIMSWVRALKMVFYNYPCCLIVFVAFCYFFIGIRRAVEIFFLLILPYYYVPLSYAIMMFLIPIPICFFTNLYIKKLHDQFKLYFGEQP